MTRKSIRIAWYTFWSVAFYMLGLVFLRTGYIASGLWFLLFFGLTLTLVIRALRRRV